MKIGIQTWGSNGDVRPFLALANGLSKAGHQVTLIATCIENQSYHEISRQLGIEYRPVPDKIDFDLADFVKHSENLRPMQWLRRLCEESFFPYQQAMYQAALELAADNDFLIGRHIQYPLKLAAQQQNKPFFSVTFGPAAIPTPYAAPFGLPNLGSRFNPFLWQAVDMLFTRAYHQDLTELWRQAGLRPPKSVLNELLISEHLNLIAVDPLFCLGHQGWADKNRVCGFLELIEDARHWQIPNNLRKFLRQGAAPVYMTFGSFQQSKAQWSMDLFLRAAKLAGCRAIVQTSSNDYPAGSVQGDVYFIGKHPHQPLFEHCAAVVHHGGAGTCHAATRAGCPSIIVPFMDEQLVWGKRMHQLGLAPKPIPAIRIDAQALAKAINTTHKDSRFRHRAEQARLSMQNVDGVNTAISLLQDAFEKIRTDY